jgi:tRNA (guanine37-N1)-methyltransferase
MRVDIITGFPGILEAPLNESMIRQGRLKKAVEFGVHDLREYTEDKHRTIDDYPYGGGAGMVLKVEPLVLALEDLFSKYPQEKAQIIMPGPKGQKLDQDLSTKLSLKEHLVFICGHYKGIDERIHEFFPITEISIGDYILSSGEIGTLVIVDTIVRLLPSVMSDIDSAWTDSFSDNLMDAPCYTRPENYRNKKVPEILLSGNHKLIEDWIQKKRVELTKKLRPDLYDKYNKTIN